MADDTTSQPDFENHLATLLQARADVIEVQPDLDAVTLATTVEPAPRRPTARAGWLAASAAVVLIAAIGLTLLTPGPGPTISGGPASSGDSAGESAAQANEEALLVWLESEATPTEVEAMAGLLIDSPVVLEMRCVGHDGTVGECSDYFAEEPDGVELIDPENLPASFRVVTSNPGDVGDLVTGVAGLDGVENTD